MKKYLSLLLAVSLIFTFVFASCQKKNDVINESEETTLPEVSQNLSVGKIPELQFSLTQTLSDIENYTETLVNSEAQGTIEGEEIIAEYVEGNNYDHYIINNGYYYFKKGEDNPNFAVMVNFGASFGFEVGISTLDDVKTSVKDLKGTESETDDDDLFFMFVELENCKKLTYTSGKYVLNFIFNDNLLIATTIYNSDLW